MSSLFPGRPVLAVAVGLLSAGLGWAVEVGGATPDSDGPYYFQTYPGAAIRLEILTAQIKRVAAARGISADGVRQLVNASEKAGQGVDVQALNRELDLRWPVK